MSRTLVSRALVPSIGIDEATVSALEAAAKQAALPGSPDAGVIIGRCDYSCRSPHILFSKFNQYVSTDSGSEIMPSSEDEVLGYVLFQKQVNIDWERALQNYIDTNQLTDDYTSSFYYQPVFTASYGPRLSVDCYLLTPDMSVSISKISDGLKNRDAKKRPGYATYTNTHERLKYIDATFLGLMNAEDSRILALAYSLALVYENKPIHALNGTSVYNIEVKLAEDILCYEGSGCSERGSVTFSLRLQGSPEPPPEPAPEPGKKSGIVLQKLTELQEMIQELQDRCDRQTEICQTFENQEIETQQMLRRLLDAVSSKPPPETQKVARYAPPRSLTTPKRQRVTLSVHMSELLERPDRDFGATPARGSPTSAVRTSAQGPQGQTVKRRGQVATPIAVPPPSVPNPSGHPPDPASVPPSREISCSIGGCSNRPDIRKFYDRIGLSPAFK
jgi:hypothetical protein